MAKCKKCGMVSSKVKTICPNTKLHKEKKEWKGKFFPRETIPGLYRLDTKINNWLKENNKIETDFQRKKKIGR